MEVICLETTAFYELVGQVVSRMVEFYDSEPPFKWVSQEKAMEMLAVTSKTTMLSFRNEGKIRFSQPVKKIILYDRHSIDKFLEHHAREVFWKESRAV